MAEVSTPVIVQGGLDGLGIGAAAARAGESRVSLRERTLGSTYVLRGPWREAAGVPVPSTPRSSMSAEGVAVLWLGPEEWLLTSDSVLEPPTGGVSVDVSDTYTVLRLEGPAASDVLAKAVSVDLHPTVLPGGAVVRTAFARITTIVHRQSADGFDLYIARSFSRYAWQWLVDAGAEEGIRATL